MKDQFLDYVTCYSKRRLKTIAARYCFAINTIPTQRASLSQVVLDKCLFLVAGLLRIKQKKPNKQTKQNEMKQTNKQTNKHTNKNKNKQKQNKKQKQKQKKEQKKTKQNKTKNKKLPMNKFIILFPS